MKLHSTMKMIYRSTHLVPAFTTLMVLESLTMAE